MAERDVFAVQKIFAAIWLQRYDKLTCEEFQVASPENLVIDPHTRQRNVLLDVDTIQNRRVLLGS